MNNELSRPRDELPWFKFIPIVWMLSISVNIWHSVCCKAIKKSDKMEWSVESRFNSMPILKEWQKPYFDKRTLSHPFQR